MSQPQKICQLNITGNLLRKSDTEPPEDWKNMEHLYYKYLETCDFSTAEPQQVIPEPDIGPNLNLLPPVEDPTPPPSPSPSPDSNLLTTPDSPQDSDSMPNFFLILLLSDSSLIESDYERSPPLRLQTIINWVSSTSSCRYKSDFRPTRPEPKPKTPPPWDNPIGWALIGEFAQAVLNNSNNTRDIPITTAINKHKTRSQTAGTLPQGILPTSTCRFHRPTTSQFFSELIPPPDIHLKIWPMNNSNSLKIEHTVPWIGKQPRNA